MISYLKSLSTRILILTALFGPTYLLAEPWIDTNDLTLRSDIQLLADLQLLSTPTTTYPLMWNSISAELNNIESTQLSGMALSAYLNIQSKAKQIFRNKTELNLNASTENNRFTSFGETNRDKTSLGLSQSIVGKSWAGKLSYQIVSNPIDGKEARFDDSYLAKNWGNWVISVGQQNRWWGPGWDTNLSLTNNARPMPALSLIRNIAEPFSLPFFNEIKIPWTLSTFMGRMEKERTIPHALLWGFRMTAKPFTQLELGITRLAQWGGDGRSQDASTFWDVFVGRDNCGINSLDCTDNQEPGNQMAGWDFRWSPLIGQQPISVYGQVFAEDGSEKATKFFTEARYQIGFDAQFYFLEQNWRVFLEATDTFADCRDDESNPIGDCYYEHHLYRTGMHYQQRTLANLYDNDARTYVLGFITQTSKNANLQFKLRHLSLNQDNSDRAIDNPFIGNTLTEIAEDILMLSSKYQWQNQRWGYSIGGQISRSTFKTLEERNEFNLQTSINYYF